MHPPLARHHGLDWLRIGAFALLILYHIGLFFTPGSWIIKTADPAPWVMWPMLALMPWRLPLLFLISGYASRAMITKFGGPRPFLRSRNLRLLLPLAFAVTFLIAPQTWVRMIAGHGYGESFLHFWAKDWFLFGVMDGVELPNTEHLWFLFYLWQYSLLLAGGVAWLPARHRQWIAAWFLRLAEGPRLLWLPLALLVALRLGLLFVVPEKHGLFNDWVGHITYLPAFLFGFGLAGAPSFWPTIRRLWKPAAIIAGAAYLALLSVEIAYPGTPAPHALQALSRAARVAMGWSAILLLLGAADRWLNRSHALQPKLAEAVFPCYIIHQTIIVLTGFWLRQYALPAGLEFAIMVAATAIGCFAFYEIGRRIGWLRPFIGLSPEPRRQVPATRPARAEA
jgi:hypothetical protein